MTPRPKRVYGSVHFFVDRMIRFTAAIEIPNVRAMVGGFRPASNDARMRFAFPSGISAIFAASTGDDTGRDAGGAGALLALPAEAPCLRLSISASTAACSRSRSASSRYWSEFAMSLGRATSNRVFDVSICFGPADGVIFFRPRLSNFDRDAASNQSHQEPGRKLCRLWAAHRGPDSGNDSHWAEVLPDKAVPEVRIARQFRYDAADNECFDAQSSCPVCNGDTVAIRK